MMENLVLLGATGSIGSSTLDVIRNYPGRFKLIGISGYKNINRLKEIIREFHPRFVCLNEDCPDLRNEFTGIDYLIGDSGLTDLAALPEADTVVMGISGIAGLHPTLAAVTNGKRLLSANKESIVAAGDVVNRLLSEKNARIIPLDSEHNAVFNILEGMDKSVIQSITLTASGGPFLRKSITADTSIQDVLKHPTWDMGSYITVNSATLMNKGFEVIEAHYLFRLGYEKIRVLIHPQSLVHGIVESTDGSLYMLASPSDMRYPISLSLFHPEIPQRKFPKLDLTKKPLEFFEPDLNKFPLLELAYSCGKAGGIMPAVLNAANEVVVDAFLNNRVRFISVPDLIRSIVDDFAGKPAGDVVNIDSIMDADHEARMVALQKIGNINM